MRDTRSRSLHGALIGGVAIAILGAAAPLGCTSSTSTVEVSVPAGATPTSAATTAPTTATTSALVSSPASGVTPGTIKCGSHDCKVGAEICCADGEDSGTCKPKGSTCEEGSVARACDESSDCKADERCRDVTAYADTCAPTQKWECAPKHAANGALTTGEVCVAGGTCGTGACKLYDTSSPVGACPTETAAMSCGGTQCKQGEACCWNGKRNGGTCIPADEGCPADDPPPGVPFALYTCERKSDCEPGFACYSNRGEPNMEDFRCRPERCSVTTIIDGPFLCDTAADCAPTVERTSGMPSTPYKLVGCKAEAGRPAGVKTCQYQ